MYISKVKIINFKCYEGIFELELNQGLNIVVGDNEAGKSTILEAIHLALTGMLNGKSIWNELSQYLFNKSIVQKYINDINNGNPAALPYILIELYLGGKETPLLNGNDNIDKLNEAEGFFFKIAFNDKYLDEYETLVKNKGVNSLPIEYYDITWTTFARDTITTRSIPYKSSLIDSSNYKCQSGSDIYLSKIIYIDEIQDLAGYDLEMVKMLLASDSNILMVGDPRQVTYHTHDEAKYKKYNEGNIEEFIEKECKKIECYIDKTTLHDSYRNNKAICDFSNLIFPEYEPCGTKQEEITTHDGIFLVKKSDVDGYLKKYNPVQLRDSRIVEVNDDYKVLNMGESKGLTFERVLIYPTKPIMDWIKDHSKELKPQARSKLYVAVTRAMHSVGVVYDYDDKINFEGICKFK